MGCNCNEIDPCTSTPCAEGDTTCNCVQKDMSTDCVLYTGDDLACSGISKNTILTVVIQQLDTLVCTIRDEVSQYLTLTNIGGGAEVYKGIAGNGNKEIRSVVSENTAHLDVVQNDDTIGIKSGVFRLELNGDTLSLIVNTDSGDTTLTNIDLSGYNDIATDTFVNAASFNPGDNILTIELNNNPDITVDLSALDVANSDNFVVSGVYDSLGEQIVLTMDDASTINIDLSTLISDIAAAQVQSDFTELNSGSAAFIVNKNPTKTVALGAAGNYDVVVGDNNYVIEIDNGVNNVTVDVSGALGTDNFFVGFVQKGTGTVTFIGHDQVPALFDPIIFDQGHVASLQIINSTKYINGNLKAA